MIQNNRNTEGAGIILSYNSYIQVEGQLYLYDNVVDQHGGAILVLRSYCLHEYLMQFLYVHYTSMTIPAPVTFSGNKALKGGSDMYGATLMGCGNNSHGRLVPRIGHPNDTSWYFDTPLMKYFHFNNTDRLSSMSSDPIMVCFCNTTSNLPDCSDRTHHIQTYPGLEINTSIATEGYYGGTSPGNVLVSAQHATIIRYYGQNEIYQLFPSSHSPAKHVKFFNNSAG